MKIMTLLMRYAYGDKARGDSLEYVAFYSALKQLGHEVVPFWIDDFLKDTDALQRKALEYADNLKPDMAFFVLMKDEFLPSTLQELKRKCITLNWFCDDQWRFEGFTRHYAPNFSFCVTTDKYSLDKYKSIGYKNAILSQFATYGYYEKIDFDNINYKYDVSFVGLVSGYRKWIIKELSKNNLRIGCFGYGWGTGVLTYEQMSEIFLTSKINLNISNSVSFDLRCMFSSMKGLREAVAAKIKPGKKVHEQIKARNFEIPAYGGFQLTNYAPSLEDYFQIGKEIDIFTGLSDLNLKVDYYLNNEAKRRELMLAGYRRAIAEHTYPSRLKEVISKITQ